MQCVRKKACDLFDFVAYCMNVHNIRFYDYRRFRVKYKREIETMNLITLTATLFGETSKQNEFDAAKSSR